MNGILLLLGTNLGDRQKNLTIALEALDTQEIQPIKLSALYESEPWGVKEQPWFLNQIIEVTTDLNPYDLLISCLNIENRMGRQRKQKWGERLIDIDILFYNDEIIQSDKLMIPHSGIPDRRFTLIPLVEHWKEFKHPISGKIPATLLKECDDQLMVKLFHQEKR